MMAGLELASGEVVPADLVIDASGRHSRLPLWLEEAGWGSPKTEMVVSRLACSTELAQEGQGCVLLRACLSRHGVACRSCCFPWGRFLFSGTCRA